MNLANDNYDENILIISVTIFSLQIKLTTKKSRERPKTVVSHASGIGSFTTRLLRGLVLLVYGIRVHSALLDGDACVVARAI